MSGFQGYDQWKTASPYDDDDDEHCAYCGADLPDDVTGFSVADEGAVMHGFCNYACEENWKGGEISPRYGMPPAPNEEQWKQIRALYAHLAQWRADHQPDPDTLEELSESFPDGDFKWDMDDPGDAHVYCCGEKDCPMQWHEAYFNVIIERKDGKLSIEIHEGDSDGNWDITCGWEEGEDFANSGVGYNFGEYALRQYFVGWLEYWLDAAETGRDPCDQAMTRPQTDNKWVDFCIKAAQSNADALPLPKD